LITKYGYDVVAVVILIVIIGSLLSWYFIEWKPVRFGVTGLLLLFFVFTLAFFRDPDRSTPPGQDLVIAPADGKVILIKNVQDEEYLLGEAVQVSIFMSPADVHVNRYPVTGRVEYFKHFPGEFIAAYQDKASLDNEQTHIGISSDGGKVLVKQIAGFIARRIVAHVSVGDRTVAGARFGMIKFGSRVDVVLPKGATLKVELGERTRAGETVVAALS
jgi:phosphatidylserine decarboxylase